MGNDPSTYTARCGYCSKTVLYSGTSYTSYKEKLESGQKCGPCSKEAQERDDRLDREDRDREDKRRREKESTALKREEMKLRIKEQENNKKQLEEERRERKIAQEKERREREKERQRVEKEKQEKDRKHKLQLEKEKRERDKQHQQQMDLHNKMIATQQSQHNEQMKNQKEQMHSMKKQQEINRKHHEKQLKLQQDAQNKLQQQILKVMDDRKEQQQQFEQREKKIKKQLDSQMNLLKAQNIKDQKEYSDKLKKLTAANDKKLEKLETVRKKDRAQYKKEMEQIAQTNEENMKKLKKHELKNRLHQEIQLCNTRLQQYKDKKERVKVVFKAYVTELTQIKLEERRIKKYFGEEINDNQLFNVVILGVTGHGKSTFACRLVGDKTENCDSGIFAHSACLYSVTKGVKKKIVRRLWKKDISVIDTPGIWDSSGDDRFHTNDLIEFLKGCGGVNAFILVKTRYPPRFESTYKNVLQNLESLFGREFWKYVIFVLTHTKGKDAVDVNFNKYASTFRNGVYKEMSLTSSDAALPFVGIDSFENYKKPLKKLIDILPRERFKCDELRSPLQELQLKNKNMKKKFENMREELNTIKQTILLSNKQIRHANKLLSKMENGYVAQNIDISLINERKDEWDIKIVLPKEKENDDNDEKMYQKTQNYNYNYDKDEKTKETKKQAQWIAYKQISYTYIGDLGDDDITVSFTDEDYKKIPWKIELKQSDDKYDEICDIFEKADENGQDVYVTIHENYYKNSLNENETPKIKRIIKNVEISK